MGTAAPGRRGGRRRGRGGAHARRAFPHLDKPAEDAEEPVLAVHRAPYAVAPGRLLVVLVPGRRRRRRVAVHDPAATGLEEPRRKPPEEARGLLAPEGPARSRHSAPCCPEPCRPERPPDLTFGQRSPRTPSPALLGRRPDRIHDCHWPPSLDLIFPPPHILCAGLDRMCSFCHMTSAPMSHHSRQ